MAERGLNVDGRGATVSGRGFDVGPTGAEILTWGAETEWYDTLDRPGMVPDEIADHSGGEAGAIHSGYYHGSLVRGLVAYYPLDEGSGTTAGDSTELGNDGTIDGATYQGSGKVGSDSLSFDGTDDHVDVPEVGITESEDFSLCFWARIDSSSISMISGATDGSSRTWGILTDTDNNIDFRVGDYGTNNEIVIVDTSGYSTGVWNHYAMTWNASKEELAAFVDGSEIDRQTGTVDEFAVSGGPYIGARTTGDLWFPGDVDDYRIYDRPLSTQEVVALSSRTETSPVPTEATL